MIKILTTKAWKSLLSRIEILEQEVKALRQPVYDTAQQQQAQRGDCERLQIRTKRIERDIKDLSKRVEKTKTK